MSLREANTAPASGTKIANLEEAIRHRDSGPALRQPSFDWKAPDKYVELLSLQMEVINIPKTKTYNKNDEGNVPSQRNWLEREEKQLTQTFTIVKRSIQNNRDCL